MLEPPTLTARSLGALTAFEAFFSRARVGVIGIAFGLAAVFGLLEPASPWRLWTLAGAAGFALGIMVFEALSERGRPGLTPGRIGLRVASVFAIHTGIIVATGGLESPALPLYIPVAVVLAIALGRRRWLLPIIGLIALVLLGLLALRLTGAPLTVPAFLRSSPAPPPDALHLVTIAAVILLIATVGGGIGLLLRGHLDRAARAEAEARAEVLAALRTQNRELGELSGRLAHELKNPLAAITGLSALVARKLEPGSREAEQMGVMMGEVKRLGGILDAFLNLSRPTEGLSMATVPPATLVADVARLYEATAASRGVTLQVEAEPCPPLRCDARKLRQVLVNLVENALNAMGGPGRLVLGAAPSAEGVRLTVRDDGPGLPQGPRARLFEAGVTTRPEGNGLGLTVARAIAHQHGGRLTLDDAPGGGAIATLDLPLSPPTEETP
ncbi:MAG: HAMP domain-containing histidine kinase [Myxococcales bacterium]|nr:HAMP domain-containing histidine kinase [Myxococcales bacterium]